MPTFSQVSSFLKTSESDDIWTARLKRPKTLTLSAGFELTPNRLGSRNHIPQECASLKLQTQQSNISFEIQHFSTFFLERFIVSSCILPDCFI